MYMSKYNNILNNKTLQHNDKNMSKNTAITVTLCGNPNSGKTTLFNALTGSNQKVGNWPGVTVERKTGIYKNDSAVTIVDTPGVYSLSPFTPEEAITRNYLSDNKPDMIVNIIDSTNLERSLYLTTQLVELNTPIVVALNMQDEAKAKGISIDVKLLEKAFGCPFISISAAKNKGIDDLIACCRKALHSSNRSALTTAHQTAEQRYDCIEKILAKAQTVTPTPKQVEARKLTDKIDSIVLNKWLAFPIFAVVMTAIFYLSIGSVGGWLTALINGQLTPLLQLGTANLLAQSNSTWLTSLICDGVIAGVMSVVGFLPQIMLLFGCISVLEASGYMSRIAFVTDKLLRQIGLGGRSFVSLVLGCGCSVPAITATRTIKNQSERDTTITLTSFMPCSAKLAVISFFTSYLLGGNALFAISFYFTSILAVITGGLILKLLSKKKADIGDAFIMELPTYRLPSATNVLKQMWERGKAFLIKAGTVIFVASIALWILTHFSFSLQLADTENSMLASIGKFIAPLFRPLGFDDMGYGWQFSVATISGIAAKETVVTTLEILLPQGIQGAISGLGAYSFVVYNLLTVPCVAAISASFAEQGSWKKGVRTLIFQIVAAYTVSLAIYQIGSLAHKRTATFTIVASVLALLIATAFAVKYIVRNRKTCAHCRGCALSTACKKEKRLLQ